MNSIQSSDEQENSTINYYNENAASFFQNTVFLDVSTLYVRFERFLAKHAQILDAGCGSGRDSLYFKEKGFDVTAFDASKEMVKKARQLTGLNVVELSFEDLEFVNMFNGIWACASLLHVPRNNIGFVINKLSKALKENGVLYSSFKYGDSEEFRHGRLFVDYNQETFKKMMEEHPDLEIIDLWVTEDIRPDHSEKWLNCILRKSNK